MRVAVLGIMGLNLHREIVVLGMPSLTDHYRVVYTPGLHHCVYTLIATLITAKSIHSIRDATLQYADSGAKAYTVAIKCMALVREGVIPMERIRRLYGEKSLVNLRSPQGAFGVEL